MARQRLRFRSHQLLTGRSLTLPHATVDRLSATRGPGESYSDVIIRVARG
jgi:hypothetical protein